MGFLHHDLKLPQVNLPDGPLGNPGVTVAAVGLLVVQGKVLRGGRDMLALHAPDQSCGLLACQQRILGIILKVPAAQRVPVDVHTGCQPDHNVVLLGFLRHRNTHFAAQFRIPGGSQQRGAGEGGCGHADMLMEADSRRAVRCHDIGNAVNRVVAVTKGVRQAHIGLTAQQGCQVFRRQCGHKGFQGHLPFRHILQLHAVLGPHVADPRNRPGFRISEDHFRCHGFQGGIVEIIAGAGG